MWRVALSVAMVSVAVEAAPLRIGFGSCSRPDQDTHVWSSVKDFGPDVWVWMGDNVYLDSHVSSEYVGGAQAQAIYSEMAEKEEYRAAVASAEVMGTWDDHDLGENNGGADFHAKNETRAMMFDFLGYPWDFPKRTGEGVYHTKVVEHAGRQVHVILLDTRWFRTETELLGEEQWVWFEQQVAEVCTHLCIVVSSIQVMVDWRSSFFWLKGVDTWQNYPTEHQRLLELLETKAAAPVLILSGDVHYGDLITVGGDGCSMNGVSLTKPVIEATSSGITHTLLPVPPYPLWAFIAQDVLNISKFAFHEKMYRPILVAKNWGSLVIDWVSDSPVVNISINDEFGQARMSKLFAPPEHEGSAPGNRAECPTEAQFPAPHPARSLAIVALLFVSIPFLVYVLPLWLLYKCASHQLKQYLSKQKAGTKKLD